MKFRTLALVLTVPWLILSTSPAAVADEGSRVDEILAVNPGLTREAFDASVADVAKQQGVSVSAVIDMMYTDSEEARSVQKSAEEQSLTVKNRELLDGASEQASSSSSGGEDDGAKHVVLGCASPGYFTYSYARNFEVRHGHNTLFVANCRAVHMPGGKIPNIREIPSDYRGIRTAPSYPAHVRRVNGASANAHARAAAFGETNVKRNVGYNTFFSLNKTDIWQTHYNCSSLVWAAWMYAANVDLDRNGGPGVYPEDLWKSPKTVLNHYLVVVP